jgi:hypothetical protein
VGWAPLPPEAQSTKGYNAKVDVEFDIGPGTYGFIAVADFDAPTYVGRFMPEPLLSDILPKTVNVTYIAPRAGGGMVCGGPDVGAINSELRRLRGDPDIKPVGRTGVQLVNTPATSAAPDVMNAGAVMYFAPQLKPLPPVGRPEKMKGRVEVKDIERGWDPANPWQVDEWRKRIRAEAAAIDAAERAAAQPPPPNVQPRVTSAPRPTPAPRPNVAPPPPPSSQQRPGVLSPSRLEPSSPLFPKRR